MMLSTLHLEGCVRICHIFNLMSGNINKYMNKALQNDKMSISDVISIYNSSSLSDIRNKIEVSEKEANQKIMQAQKMQLQQQQKQRQDQRDIDLAKIKLEQDRQDREDARNKQDNDTKIEIAKMNANKRQ